ncbi:hypothetical protein [Halosimplex pelagicum]|uniref:Uncharacterized protein n=1 Tax=Halosimplex pelagicum TaxID=869886 RepID=A0A7D5TW84_9EURY|nr:hypothetical protein [Halosimplex pelagicum]QLH83814.1 hypothetical protein HZS54_20230 [Halosimplex pelagicum]
MQSNDTGGDIEADELYRAEHRLEVLPNFVSSRPDKARTESEGRALTPRDEDGGVSIIRDGDEYLAVGSGGDEDEKNVWMERVPAVRQAVVQGEQLWRIPNNWVEFLRVHSEDAPDRLLYQIPDPEVYVVVRAPRGDGNSEPRYLIEEVGPIEVEITERPDREALDNLLAELEAQSDPPEIVVSTLEILADHVSDFERKYRKDMGKRGQEAVWKLFKSEQKGVVESWSINPWDTEQDITHFIPETRYASNDVLKKVASRLIEAGVVSPSPSIEVTVKNGKRLPAGYFLQALTEAGCSPTEALDWTMVKTRGHTEATWSEVRGEAEQQIAENIHAAEITLSLKRTN